RFVIAKAKTSETWGFALLSPRTIFDQALTVITSDSYIDFAVLQSGIHEVWARESGAGSKMKTDLRYAPTMFQTFPFPFQAEALERKGLMYFEHRREMMSSRQEGMTSIYSRLNTESD